jgi:hypothetical protein
MLTLLVGPMKGFKLDDEELAIIIVLTIFSFGIDEYSDVLVIVVFHKPTNFI